MPDHSTSYSPRPPARSPRKGRKASFLMCRPEFFDVTYSINPWMDVSKPVDPGLAVAQWERLRDIYLDLGHQVQLIDPAPGLPDMVFAANGATVVDGRVLMARFRFGQRAAEAGLYGDWFRAQGYREVHAPRWTNEGEGDYLLAGRHLLAGTGFRTDPRSHEEAAHIFGRPVHPLALVDARFYHLDTALGVLDDETVMYYPAAFSPESQRLLQKLFPAAVIASAADAEAFGLNAVSDGHHVVLPHAATGLAAALWDIGYQPIGVDVSELQKAGGAVKCCTLELRPA